MITCSINGHVAYPLTSDTIKITQENPYIKDSGEYTYEISFPMSLTDNRRVFHNVQHFNVSKELASYEDCKLYVDNRLVMSGKGVVTNITEKMVKLQLVGGKSRIKYNSRFEEHYIDEIPFDLLTLDVGWDEEEYSAAPVIDLDTKIITIATGNGKSGKYAGQTGVGIFYTVYDESNDIRVNEIRRKVYAGDRGGAPEAGEWIMINLAVQPNFMFVLRKIMEYEGITIVRNDIDCEPWNKMYIANAYKTVEINKALPRWTVYHFIEEVAKLFGVTFLFDDAANTLSIINKSELSSGKTIALECSDEFNAEFQEDDISSTATDNLKYNLSETERLWTEDMPISILEKYDIVDAVSIDDINNKSASMTEKQKLTTLFRIEQRYYTFAYDDADEEGDESDTNRMMRLTRVGIFGPLIQNEESEDATEIDIVPASIVNIDAEVVSGGGTSNRDLYVCPSVKNPRKEAEDELTSDDGQEYYVTIKDAIEGTEDTREDLKDKGTISLYFIGADFNNMTNYAFTHIEWDKTNYSRRGGGRVGADGKLTKDETEQAKVGASLELWNIHKIFDSEIDDNNTMQIDFFTESIPSARDIYMFRGKKYVCAKIESEIKQGRLSVVHRGYFYEIKQQ